MRVKAAPRVRNLKNSITDSFFAIETVKCLRAFYQNLDPVDPIQRAMQRYVGSWDAIRNSSDDTLFEPLAHISTDLSAALFGKCPCIFMGTNNWAVKAVLPEAELSPAFDIFFNRVAQIRMQYKKSRLIVTIAPEKDYLIDALYYKSGNYSGIEKQILKLKSRLSGIDAGLCFFESLIGMERYQKIEDFAYPDSHLTARNYIQMFANQLVEFGVDWPTIERRIGFSPRREYCDLSNKLNGHGDKAYFLPSPDIHLTDVSIIGGFDYFQDPLGETWQRFTNGNPAFQKSVLILGDSHSSIYSSRKLTYAWASVARETEFHWNPCGVRGDGPRIDPDFVILEISLRFI